MHRLNLGDALTSDIGCRAPWHDYNEARRSSHENSREDSWAAMYAPAVAEIQHAFADGREHPISDARAIADRHHVGVYSLMDRAGIWFSNKICIYARRAV